MFCTCGIPPCYDNLIYEIWIGQNVFFLDIRFYMSKTATCFDLYIGHPQAHTIPKAHIVGDDG